jgi:hypothetical protein
MAHSSRTAAAAGRRKLAAARNRMLSRLHRLLCEAFPEYWTHIGDQFAVGVKDNLVIIGIRRMFIDRHNLRGANLDDVYGIRRGAKLPNWGPPADLVQRVINARMKPIYVTLQEIYATLPDPASATVEVRVGGMMPVHPRQQKLLLLLSAIESAFPRLKRSPGYGSTATASNDNSLLIHVDGDITPDDLERVCRIPGKVHVRLKDVCDTTGLEGHEDEPLSPIHLKVNDAQKTITYASIFDRC